MAQWTDEEDEFLKTALADGLSPSQIHVGDHSLKAIYSRMNRLGLHSHYAKGGKQIGYALRKCLPCGRTFGSSHIGNRICPQCVETHLKQVA